MADDAFAISPISARPAQPSEADYEAINSAFMETARGRWFLSEFARRNRNADTRMVLDAVARIESTVAANRGFSGAGLDEALADLRAAVEESRRTVGATANSTEIETLLIPIRKGARVVREIAWRWREIGADGRICDLLETHVNAMEAGCDQLATCDPASALLSELDRIEARIDRIAQAEPATPPDRTARPEQSSRKATATAVIAEAELAPLFTAAEVAEDDAVLDAIALQMGAPDDDDDDLAAHDDLFEPAPSSAHSHAPASLGAALIETGVIGAQPSTGRDPFAPLRRMTQAERIAFFS